MNENIKEIIIICIIALLISVMFNSCAKAWSWEDMVAYSEAIKNNSTTFNATVRAAATQFYNNQQTYKARMLTNGIDVEDYTNFTYYYYNGSTIIKFWNTTSNSTYVTSSSKYDANNVNGYRVDFSGTNYSNSYTQTSISWSGYDISRWFGLQTQNVTNFYSLNLENKLAFVDYLPITTHRIDNLPWYMADSIIGVTYNNVEFYIHNTTTGEEVRLYKAVETGTYYGRIYELNLTHINGIINNDTYYIVAKSGTTDIAKTEEFILSYTSGSINSGDNIPSGTITNQSGDITGNIDLSGIENAINNLPQNIGKEFYNKESGEKGIIQKVYDDLFTISDGYIENKLDELKQNTISGDTTYEKAFLNIINSNNGDFKIAWQSFSPHFSIGGQQIAKSGDMIPSGEVNFSKLERDNVELQESMKWVRIILGFALGSLLLRNIWKTLMTILGVNTKIFDTEEENIKVSRETIRK